MQIEFIEGLGVFIVKGQKADVEKVIKLIEQIDAITGTTQPTILIHPLKHVNSVVLSDLIEDLYDDVFGTRLSPVNITPLDKPNAPAAIPSRTMPFIRSSSSSVDGRSSSPMTSRRTRPWPTIKAALTPIPCAS